MPGSASEVTSDAKTAVITGANSGIGKVTACELAKNGLHIVMICRNREKAERARDEIISSSQNEDVDITLCNLDSMKEIHDTGKKIRGRYPAINVLVNNAGIVPDGQRKLTDEGFELTFAVNHLSYFLLTRQLMPSLEKAESARIINVASEAHKAGKFNPENLQLDKGYNAIKAYGNSKLFNIMYTYELSRRLKGSNITTYSLHPGAVNTNLASDSKSLFGWLFNLGKVFMLSPEEGAKTTIWLSSQPGIEDMNGLYFKNCNKIKPADIAHDDNACKKLWELTQELLRSV